MDKPSVCIILGSKSDREACLPLQEQLQALGINSELHVSSAHRNPERTVQLVKAAEQAGVRIFIACAGMAAHLPGVVASHTVLPVIGVPLSGGSLGGQDALYSIVQMPTGVPVATVAINGVKNAALLAAEILALSEAGIRQRLLQYRQDLARG